MMRDVEKLLVEQLDGSFEEFNIGFANDLVEVTSNKLPDGCYEYRIYKNSPFRCFDIQVREIDGKFYLRHIENNGHPEYEGKNITFPALCYISKQLNAPIHSSAKHPNFRIDELDRLKPDTMGVRWFKMMTRYPDRVKDLGERFVLYPA